MFSCKIFKITFFYRITPVLHFKMRNINNLFKDVSMISLAHNRSLITYNSQNDKVIRNIIHLPKLVPIEHFCSRFSTNSLLPKIWSKYWNLCCYLPIFKNLRYLAKSSRIYIFLIRTFLVFLNDQSFSSFHWKN